MKDIYRDPHTNNYDVDITVEEWKEILCLPEVISAPNILDALEKWYRAPSCTASCKRLTWQYGHSPQYYSTQNRRLGEIATRYLNRLYLIGADGRQTYWAVCWIERGKRDGEYIVQLRPELVEAIRQLKLFD